MSKWQKILMAVLGVLVVCLGLSAAYMLHKINGLNDEVSTAQNILDAKNAGLQDLNNKLGIAQSDLVTSDVLNKKYASELDTLQSEFKDITKKYKLQLESRDKVIAQLKGKVNGGETTVVVVKEPATNPDGTSTPQVISYTWEDFSKRFKLVDPDIFVKDNENFEYKQQVAITGYVYTDKSGELKIRKLVLQEVVPNPNGDGFVPVDGSKIDIVDNKFEYIKLEAEPKSIFDIWHPRLLVSFDTQLYPGIGVELINLGRYIDYANIGLNTKVAVNTLNGLEGIKSSTVGIGLAYQLAPPLIDTNIGLGVGLSTPMDNFLGRYIVTVDAIFYLTN